jgi:protein involved in ribonucleotide reduction
VKVYARYSKTPDAPIAVDDELRGLMRDIAKVESEISKSQQEYEAEKKA